MDCLFGEFVTDQVGLPHAATDSFHEEYSLVDWAEDIQKEEVLCTLFAFFWSRFHI